MACPETEQTVGLVIRASLDPPKATASRWVAGAVEMQFVEAVLGEHQCALGAVDFEIMLHLLAGGDPASFDAARCAVGEPQQRSRDVVGLDDAAATAAVRSAGDHVDAIAHHLGDLSD